MVHQEVSRLRLARCEDRGTIQGAGESYIRSSSQCLVISGWREPPNPLPASRSRLPRQTTTRHCRLEVFVVTNQEPEMVERPPKARMSKKRKPLNREGGFLSFQHKNQPLANKGLDRDSHSLLKIQKNTYQNEGISESVSDNKTLIRCISKSRACFRECYRKEWEYWNRAGGKGAFGRATSRVKMARGR